MDAFDELLAPDKGDKEETVSADKLSVSDLPDELSIAEAETDGGDSLLAAGDDNFNLDSMLDEAGVTLDDSMFREDETISGIADVEMEGGEAGPVAEDEVSAEEILPVVEPEETPAEEDASGLVPVGEMSDRSADEPAAVSADMPQEGFETDERAAGDDADVSGEGTGAVFADAVERYGSGEEAAGRQPAGTPGVHEFREPNFVKWYSGSSADDFFELDRHSEGMSLDGNAYCHVIHINVGYDTYGWRVEFADGTVMGLSDVREYQLRNGKLPCEQGTIIYGSNRTSFSSVDRIVIYQSVQYFSYAPSF